MAFALRLRHNALSLGTISWLLLWMGINTGPGNLDLGVIEGSRSGFLNGVRAAFPLALFAVWLFHLLARKQRTIRRFTWPEALWLYYGIVCLVAGVYADPWFAYSYWGFAYLSAFGATEMYLRESSDPGRAADLNWLNWVLGSAVLAIVVWVARGVLLAPSSTGVSGYGVIDRLPTVAGMPMVRASGISRLAAIPALVAFPLIWQTQGRTRIFWAAVFVPSAYLVWVMQSRGSLTSFVLALAFVMVMLGGSTRRVGIGVIAALVVVFMLGFISDEAVHHLWLYAARGTQGQELASMSGRTRIFHEAWEAIKAAPFIGYGPQADRQIPTIGNAQNGVLYALLCGGFLGGSGYVGGLLVSWLMLFRIGRYRHLLDPAERITFVQVAGMMAFFTIRSYPENCAALFSVDLLLQLPAIVYLGELDRRIRHLAAQRPTSPLRQRETVIANYQPVHVTN